MSTKFTACPRLLCAAGITLALLGLASQSAFAQATQSVQEAPTAANVTSTDAMTVVRDATTGKLRAPTADEQTAMQAAHAKHALRASPKATQQKVHASGARGARLTDDFASSEVAVRQPDGTVAMQCFDDHDAATQAVATAHVHTVETK